ncbi:unnamed protein product [Lactuca saligna]|uniref:Uncharacterized protein n=1 Tax=Lactuca saligna TaxID=75948 RepID=A0AA35VGF6_LACSI|nr:unnamed protein product [Lactuca saligna]
MRRKEFSYRKTKKRRCSIYIYSCPKDAADDTDEFPFVARISDAMLKRVDPTNIVLITYLQSIDTSVETRVLVAREEEKNSKRSKKVVAESSKKSVKESTSTKSPKKVSVSEAEPIQPEIVVADTPSTQKEIIPSNTGVFRRIKMKSKHKSHSPFTIVVRKPQVSNQGVIFHEIPAAASPPYKKRRATETAKHISKKKKNGRVIISSESTTDETEIIPETLKADHQKDNVIPPKVSIAKTVSVEAQTSDIFVNISNMDASITMGEDASHVTVKGKSSDVTPDTTVSFSSLVTPIILTTSTTDSPTFANIIQQPFTSLFFSQSTDSPTTTSPIKDSSFMETEHESEGFGRTFENLEIDEEETDFPDHMLMKMKQLKILNTKLNSILQSRAYLGGGNSVTSLEVDE